MQYTLNAADIVLSCIVQKKIKKLQNLFAFLSVCIIVIGASDNPSVQMWAFDFWVLLNVGR
jgi:hypothetical protein